MKRLLIFIKDIVQYIYEQIMSKRSYQRYIFMFHMVSDDKSLWYDERYAISMKSFKYIVTSMRERGFEFASIEGFMKRDGKKKILLTFDDAYKEVYYNVFPYLKDNSIPFVVFQTWDYLNQKGYLDDYMLNEMIRFEGCELGSHGLEHVKFSEMKQEMGVFSLLESKQKLEERFGVDVSSIAFPYGSVSAVRLRDVQNAKKTQYKYAFGTVNKGIGKRIYRKYYLPRMNLNEANVKKIVERCGHINEH